MTVTDSNEFPEVERRVDSLNPRDRCQITRYVSSFIPVRRQLYTLLILLSRYTSITLDRKFSYFLHVCDGRILEQNNWK